jgi:transcription elongation factor Elf1
MAGNMGNMDFGIPCPSCGRKITAKLSKLKKGAVLKCGHCQKAVKIANSAFKDARRRLEDFGKSIR